jgi:hypothetical protein
MQGGEEGGRWGGRGLNSEQQISNAATMRYRVQQRKLYDKNYIAKLER